MSEMTGPVNQPDTLNSKSSDVLEIGRNIVQERFFFFLLLALLAFLSFLLIWPNLMAILAAIALVVILKPLYNWFLEKRWIAGSPNRATAVTIVTFLLLIAAPLIVFIWLAINQANELLVNALNENILTTDAWVEGFQTFLNDLSTENQIDLNSEELLTGLQENIASFTNWIGLQIRWWVWRAG